MIYMAEKVSLQYSIYEQPPELNSNCIKSILWSIQYVLQL